MSLNLEQAGRKGIPRDYLINQQIRAREVLVIDEKGNQLGVMSLSQALDLAEGRETDLVEVAPNASPPVCRLMDYGKFRFLQSKREREARKSQKTTELREVRLRPKIGQHDVDFKTRHVRRLIEEGDKVKVTVRFRGRENTHPELAVKLLQRVAEGVTDIAGIDNTPTVEGNAMSMILAPVSMKGSKQKQAEKSSSGQVQD